MTAKVWLITGASSGLGRAMTEYVLAKGDIAVATLRKPEALDDLVLKHDKSKLLVLRLDVSKKEEIDTAFSRVQQEFGRLDVVYSNAGYGLLGEVESIPEEAARAMFDVNFWGTVNVARASIKFFRENNRPSGGHLMTVTSMAGYSAMPVGGYYSASKFATEAAMEALSKEIIPDWNIKTTIIAPGGYATEATSTMVTYPQIPAYASSASSSIRALFAGPELANLMVNDVQKAVREIYKIGNSGKEENLPLRIPLGMDSVQTLKDACKSREADLEKALIFSDDLLK